MKTKKKTKRALRMPTSCFSDNVKWKRKILLIPEELECLEVKKNHSIRPFWIKVCRKVGLASLYHVLWILRRLEARGKVRSLKRKTKTKDWNRSEGTVFLVQNKLSNRKHSNNQDQIQLFLEQLEPCFLERILLLLPGVKHLILWDRVHILNMIII